MNYKNLIPNRDTRLKILGMLEFIPDKLMLMIQYRIKTGKKLNLSNPQRFTEKIQWYKLNYRDPLMTICSDKYQVREYVKGKGLEEILVPLYGFYTDANEIDFQKLPSKFVLKTTNASHTNILCKDREKLNIDETRRLLNQWLKKRTVKSGREWAYYNIKPLIICEKYLETDKNNDLIDYKFYGFRGKVEYMKVIMNRFSREGHSIGIFNRNFEQLPYYRKGVQRIKKEDIVIPPNFNRMLEIAEILSEDFPHVRVDLYNIDGDIYFSELTFYDASGYGVFTPDEFDFILGEEFKIP